MNTRPTGQTREFSFAKGMTVAQAWAQYMFLIYGGVTLPPDQELETRQAFIAGVAWMLGAMMALPEDEDAGVALMQALQAEIVAFSAETQARAAARAHLPPPGTRF